MNIQSLEWLPFLERAAPLASSLPGRQKILDLADSRHWAASIDASRVRQQETRDASELLAKSDLWGSLVDLETADPLWERLGKSSLLDASEWCIARRWLRAIEAFRTAELPEEGLELFRAMSLELPDVSAALRRLDRLFTPEGELSENATPELARIGSELRQIKREISVRMDSLARDYHQKGVLQDQFTDVRDGRYVLPVRISAQHEVPGLLHEASASRQTVFIEPREITELNNRLRRHQNEWLQEVHRILSELSRDLAPGAAAWSAATSVLVHWDAIHARAAVARHYEGLPIECGGDAIDLTRTAHPLLWWTLPVESIQRNSIELDSSRRALLITGPNTGGKTVLLKTIGLAAAFARTGFFFPGDRPARVPFFGAIAADLGDSQSIESHLSSFSSHLRAFREILSSSGPGTLVLLDELNSATDPEEGAALSRALLETLLDQGAWLVTTTHDPVLKSLGRKDSRIVTAAMAFDENTRTPTYRLEIGVPGRSRALETAERLGIPTAVLDRARSHLSTQHREWETWVGELEIQVREARLARQQADEKRLEVERQSEQLARQLRDLKSEIGFSARQKIRHILEQAQEGVRLRLQALEQEPSRKRIESSRNELVREIESRLSAAESAVDDEAARAGVDLSPGKSAASSPPPSTSAAPVLEPGMSVRVPRWKTTGKVLSVHPDGQIKVALGTLQMLLKREDYELLDPKAARGPKRDSVTIAWQASTRDDAALPLGSSLDLRGLRLDEALARAERYLERVFTTGRFAQVTLVHGLGTGALREGIRKLLGELPFVADYRDGGTGMGGTGATLVELARK